jgi:hypothetical protein
MSAHVRARVGVQQAGSSPLRSPPQIASLVRTTWADRTGLAPLLIGGPLTFMSIAFVAWILSHLLYL